MLMTFPFGLGRGDIVRLEFQGTRRRRQNLRGLEVAILHGFRTVGVRSSENSLISIETSIVVNISKLTRRTT